MAYKDFENQVVYYYDKLEQEFATLCSNGKLEEAKKLLEEKPGINISAHNEYAFRESCGKGQLEVAKWLLNVKPDIDISAYDEYAFRLACKGGHIEVAEWLKQLYPEKYDFEVLDGKIVSYRV